MRGRPRHSNGAGFIFTCCRYHLMEIFRKKPYIAKTSWSNCIRIRIYQKEIQKRLKIPFSPRRRRSIKIPQWILAKKEYRVRYLRGLYEAEGSMSVHRPTGTYKFSFSNKNVSMLSNVFRLMRMMGFHPHRDDSRVQLSRREEVYRAVHLLQFRRY